MSVGNSKKEKTGLLSFFFTMLRIGAIGFGGGSALIPVLYQECVKEKKYVNDEQFEEMVMIANITPGALPVEIVAGVGHQRFGWKGAVAAAYGMTLPGVMVSVLLLMCVGFLNENVLSQFRYLSVGISAYIAIMLVQYILGTFKKRGDSSEFQGKHIHANIVNLHSMAMILIVFVLTGEKNIYRIFDLSRTPFFNLATIDIFIIAFFLIHANAYYIHPFRVTCSFLIGVAYVVLKSPGIPVESTTGLYIVYGLMLFFSVFGLSLPTEKKEEFRKDKRKHPWYEDICALFVIAGVITVISILLTGKSFHFAVNSLLASNMSFGGGDAFITVADGMFVRTNIIQESVFYEKLIPIVNVNPGSILCKTLSCVGFCIGKESPAGIVGGIVLACLGMSVSIAASCGIFSSLYMIYEKFGELPTFIAIKNWIRPIVAGLMFTVIGTLIYSVKKIGGAETGGPLMIVFAALFALGSVLLKKGVSKVVVTGLLGVIAVVACNIIC